MLLQQLTLPPADTPAAQVAAADALYAAHGERLLARSLAVPGSLRLADLAAWFADRGPDVPPRVLLLVQARIVAARMERALVASFAQPKAPGD